MIYPRFIIFASYGNDSIALLQWARINFGKEHNVAVVYSDTGWAADWWESKRVLPGEEFARSCGFEPFRTTSIGLPDLVRKKKAWPRQGMQFCTSELKIEPALAWMEDFDPFGMATVMVGVRRCESRMRSVFPLTLDASPAHGDRSLFAPLVDHDDAARDALCTSAGFDVLPHRSKECFPCINDNRADLKLLDEPTVEKVETLENEMGVTSKGKRRTMFRPYRHMGATGIREIVRWAASDRGAFDPDDGTGGGGCDGGYCGT